MWLTLLLHQIFCVNFHLRDYQKSTKPCMLILTLISWILKLKDSFRKWKYHRRTKYHILVKEKKSILKNSKPTFPQRQPLTVMLDIFLFCFQYQKTAFLKQKNAFHFISKALFVLEIFKFKNFRILDFKTSSNVWHKTRHAFYWITWEGTTVW